jgi:hypothetical protein
MRAIKTCFATFYISCRQTPRFLQFDPDVFGFDSERVLIATYFSSAEILSSLCCCFQMLWCYHGPQANTRRAIVKAWFLPRLFPTTPGRFPLKTQALQCLDTEESHSRCLSFLVQPALRPLSHDQLIQLSPSTIVVLFSLDLSE